MQGLIFDVRHFSVNDGPGIRTSIFLKGCPLNCWWCHNPESQNLKIQQFSKEEKLDNRTFISDYQVGRLIESSDLMQQIEKDRIFFDESGGGVTFSGGEPFQQYEFLSEMLDKCNENGFRTAIDTSGFVNSEIFLNLCKKADLILFDIKHMNDSRHKELTGVSNVQILNNLKLLSQNQIKTSIRFPLIPQINDSEQNIGEMISFLKPLNDKNLQQIHILPYHKIGLSKYNRFSIQNRLPNVEEPTEDLIERVKNKFEAQGFIVKIGG